MNSVTRVEFLGFIISVDGVSMDPERVATIKDWPVLKSFQEVQVFLEFANFYCQFIQHYSRLVGPLTDLLKGSQNGRKAGPFE